VRDAAGHLAHGPQALLLQHLPLSRLELGQGLLQSPVAALQGRL